MSSRPLTNYQRRAWIINSLIFALMCAVIMYYGNAFDGDLGFPIAVYVVVVGVVSALLRAVLRGKTEQEIARPFSKRR